MQLDKYLPKISVFEGWYDDFKNQKDADKNI